MNTAIHDWARHFMWNRLLHNAVNLTYLDRVGVERYVTTRENYAKAYGLRICDFKPEEQDYEKAREKLGMNTQYICPTAIVESSPSFAYSAPITFSTITGITAWSSNYAEQEKENNMISASVNMNDDAAKRYALSRIERITETHCNDIHEKYAEPRPETLGEMKKWLKDGNYRLDFGDYKDETSYDSYRNLYDFFKWGKTGPDTEARDKSFKDMYAAYQEAKDIINISTDEDKRLKAIQDFESYTIH